MFWQLTTPIEAQAAGQPLSLTHLSKLEWHVDTKCESVRLTWETGCVRAGEWFGFSRARHVLEDLDYTAFLEALSDREDNRTAAAYPYLATAAAYAYLATVKPELEGAPA